MASPSHSKSCFSAVFMPRWMWVVREFPKNLPYSTKNQTSFVKFYLVTVWENYWLAAAIKWEGLDDSTKLLPPHFHFIPALSRGECTRLSAQLEKERQTIMNYALCLAVLAAVYCSVDSKVSKYFFSSAYYEFDLVIGPKNCGHHIYGEATFVMAAKTGSQIG